MTRASSVDVLEVAKAEDMDGVARGAVRAFFDHRGLNIQGWVIGCAVPAVEVELIDSDKGSITCAPIYIPRPDIAEAINDSVAAATAGFRVVLEASGSGTSTVKIRVVLSDGSAVTLGHVHLRVSASAKPGRKRLWRRSHFSRSADGVTWSILSTSGENEKVLRGRDGWLFLRGDSNDVIGQHTGYVSLRRTDRRTWRHVFEQRVALAEELGVIWLCVVIPDKESVYPEHLPPDIMPSARRPVHQILSTAKRVKAPVIYSLADLENAKPNGELYSKTDTHWNHRGAYVVYQLICAELIRRNVPVRPVDEGAIDWSEKELPGDLGGKIHPDPIKSPVTWATLKEHKGRLVFKNGIRNRGQVWIFERDDLDDGATCVVFGESFAGNLLLFLKESFRRVVVVHTSMFVKEIVAAEDPDIVLSIPLERFMVQAPNDSDSLVRLAAVVSEKGGQLPWVPVEENAVRPT